jgi:DNA-binding CsgD family transcriptional regulator
VSIALILIYFFLIFFTLTVIFLAYKLWKKNHHKFLNFFFYYIIFFNIYGFLNFSGKSFALELYQGSEFDALTTILVIASITTPAFLISIYFLYAWAAELLEIRLTVWFKTVFWIIQVLILGFFFYIFFTFMRTKSMELITPFSRILGYAVNIMIFAAVFFLLFGASKVSNPLRKRLSQNLGWIYLVMFFLQVLFSYILMLPLYRNIFLHDLFFSTLYFSINIPPLLYLHHFLSKHGFKIEAVPVPVEGLERFLTEFNITDREKEIITLLIEGLSNKKISKKLFISIKTVKNHVTNIYTKTSVRNRVQLNNLIRNY